jgi:hypothetical protein
MTFFFSADPLTPFSACTAVVDDVVVATVRLLILTGENDVATGSNTAIAA